MAEEDDEIPRVEQLCGEQRANMLCCIGVLWYGGHNCCHYLYVCQARMGTQMTICCRRGKRIRGNLRRSCGSAMINGPHWRDKLSGLYVRAKPEQVLAKTARTQSAMSRKKRKIALRESQTENRWLQREEIQGDAEGKHVLCEDLEVEHHRSKNKKLCKKERLNIASCVKKTMGQRRVSWAITVNENTQAINGSQAGESSINLGQRAVVEPNQVSSPTVMRSRFRGLDSTFLQRIFEFTRTEEFVSANIYALRARLELLETRWKDFELEYLQLLNVPGEENVQNNNECFSAGEEAYLKAKAVLFQRIDALKDTHVEGGVLTDRNVVRQLGDILSQDRLPVFNGDFTQWATFRDLFRMEVHENQNFTDAQKLKKLLNALDGAAKRAVGDWRITEGQGYKDAWKALTRQYDNDYRTIRAHLQKVYELKPMRIASFEDMSESFYSVRNARRNLKSMLTVDQLSDYQFLHQLEVILDADSKREWEMRRDTNTLPTLDEMFEFLERRAMFLSGLPVNRTTVTEHKAVVQMDGQIRTFGGVANLSTPGRRSNQVNVSRLARPAERCIKCGKNCYALFRCSEFGALASVERAQFVADKLLCRICFSSRHKTDQCYKPGCQKPQCGERHNSVLCPLNPRLGASHPSKKEATVTAAVSSAVASSQLRKSSRRDSFETSTTRCRVPPNLEELSGKDRGANLGVVLALLATARVRIEVSGAIVGPFRALCDTGSQVNLITEAAVRMNGLPTKQCSVRIAGINATTRRPFTRKVVGQLFSHLEGEPIMKVELLVMPGGAISHLPSEKLPMELVPTCEIPRLADPEFNIVAPVDILLGAGVWAECVLARHSISGAGIIMQESGLGLLLYGGGINHSTSAVANHAVFDATDEDLSKTLQRFWELEEMPQQRTRTNNQQQCERFIIESHQRMDNGQYVVGIPLRSDVAQLGSSREIALRRFYQLERRFARDPELHKKYCAGINELIAASQMCEVTRPPGEWCYHMPHHPVLKKFRIVFDASCKTDRGLSLNGVQLVGEKLQDNLFDLVMRFRTHRIGITADIQKMYLQIGIHQNQWDLQRVFWRENPQSELKEYWLTVVTFGMASAPHCAVRAMQQCATDEFQGYPRAAQIVKKDFYMDDCLTGANDKAEAQQICTELIEVLAKGCFMLDKWHSNEPDVVPTVPAACQSAEAVELSASDDTTILGLRWIPGSDELTFKFHLLVLDNSRRETMRQVLSQIARIFDPNGYLGPAIIIAKMIMQRIWESGISWDSVIPLDIARDWIQWRTQVSELAKIKIPRWLGTGPNVSYSLHGFADASEKAFGAVVYVRIENPDGIQCMLVASRSRVAPIKKITIPRLELCAAKLLGELLQAVKLACGFNFIKATLWTDSAIVLQWMKKEAASLKSFVHNRVQSILNKTTDCDWRHVPTETNPADLLSRGIAPNELETSDSWWHGPKWLQQGSDEWPNSQPELSIHIEKQIVAEMKTNWLDHANDQQLRPIQKAHVNTVTLEMRGKGRFRQNTMDMVLRTSTLRRLVRRTAYIRRFFYNYCHEKNKWRLEPLTEEEEEQALWCLVRREQRKCYEPELKALLDPDGFVPAKSQVLQFNPFIDANGIMRIGGRLEAADIPYEQMHPVLLPEVSHLAELLIRAAHQETLHGGRQLMAAHLRRRFWITGLRRAIRKNNRRCITCVRHKQKVAEQLMGSLPADRVRQCDAFQHSGVDYAGPFETKPRPGRCKFRDKKWVAVFVCMATRAVHLELVDGLSTQDFIKAFIRFTSLRGKCTHLWSDHGTNFVGADAELERMVKSWADADNDAYRELRDNMRVNWHFITPSAPHQGGLWEAAVKSMKFHLRRLVGGQTLLDSDMRTILAQITAVLNSRPLTALSDDHDDLRFLTPNHLLNLRPMSQLFGEQIKNKPRSLLARFELTQYLAQQFWKSWHSEYLNELQQRPKWQKARENIKVGDLVLIKEDNTLPTIWKTGRITKTFAGIDGLVRNVQLIISGKKRPLERPIQKLCLLPLREFEEPSDSAKGQGVAAYGTGHG